MSSLVGLKKIYSISRKSTDFGQFLLPRSTFKNDFLNVGGKFQKTLGTFVRGGCEEHYVIFLVFYLQKSAGGVAVLQVDIFQNL